MPRALSSARRALRAAAVGVPVSEASKTPEPIPVGYFASAVDWRLTITAGVPWPDDTGDLGKAIRRTGDKLEEAYPDLTGCAYRAWWVLGYQDSKTGAERIIYEGHTGTTQHSDPRQAAAEMVSALQNAEADPTTEPMLAAYFSIVHPQPGELPFARITDMHLYWLRPRA